MNVENIKRVRDHIAGLPAPLFDMQFFCLETECGTVHCIAGWAAKILEGGSQDRAPSFAREAFGLTSEQASQLFYVGGVDDHDPLWLAGPAQAVRVLDHLIETGEVNWTIAREATQ